MLNFKGPWRAYPEKGDISKTVEESKPKYCLGEESELLREFNRKVKM
jgi:hypothetical protein